MDREKNYWYLGKMLIVEIMNTVPGCLKYRFWLKEVFVDPLVEQFNLWSALEKEIIHPGGDLRHFFSEGQATLNLCREFMGYNGRRLTATIKS